MPMTKLDQVLRAVRNGNFEFERQESKKGTATATTRSGASPKKAAAPQVQPKEESAASSASSSASSSQAKAEDVSKTFGESRSAHNRKKTWPRSLFGHILSTSKT